MRKPSIHINGTSAEDLKNDYWNAIRAVRKALDEVGRAYPNGRDYYPQGEEAFSEAANEHYDRIRRLESVQTELLDIYDHILTIDE